MPFFSVTRTPFVLRPRSRCRDGEIKASSADGLANEKYLFHGTGRLSAEEVIRHPKGLDPGFSKGGFFGRGIYLAANPAYPIGGRYAHRLPGSDGQSKNM